MTAGASLEVLLAMPRAMLRSALTAALTADGTRVTATGSVDEATACARHLPLDVAVVALESSDGYPGFDLSLCRAVLAQSPACGVLPVSDEVTPELARAAVAAGASGVFDQTHGLELLQRAVQAVAVGEFWLPRTVVASVIRGQRSATEGPTATDSSPLTTREREVVRLLAAGKDHRAIAIELLVSPNTARTHIRNVMRKLGAHSRLEAVARARAQNLLLDTGPGAPARR